MAAETPNIRKEWISNDGKLVFTFRWQKGMPPDTGVDVHVYWRKQPDQGYPIDMERPLADKECPFDFVYPDGTRIYGTLGYVFFNQAHTWAKVAVWGNFHYGTDTAKRHFEGTMIVFETETEPQPPPPYPPEPDQDQPLAPIIEPAESAGDAKTEHELFPYVYLRRWPEITPQELACNFVQYTASGELSRGDQLPVQSFFKDLSALKSGGGPEARWRMEQLAVAFIQGDEPWQGCFVDFVQTRLQPLKGLCRLYEIVAAQPGLSPEELLLETAGALDLEPEEVVPCLKSQDYKYCLERVWQSYFALIITLGYRPGLLETDIRLLITAHLLTVVLLAADSSSRPCSIRQLHRAGIILPKAVFPLPPYALSPPVSPPTARYTEGWIEPYAIGELQMVHQHLLRYERGDIASIVNVLKGERREVTRRALTRCDESFQNAAVDTQLVVNDHLEGMTDLRGETLKTIGENMIETSFNDFNTTYGPPTNVQLSGNWQMAFKPGADTPAKKDISRFARRVLNRTASRISRRISRTRSMSTLNENEQTVTSVFDNTAREKNIRGIYRWVNEVYRINVVNYGNRLMIEFMLPSPAARFIRSEAELEGENLTQPMTLADFKITSYHDVTPDNYALVAAYYEVTDLTPPPAPLSIASAVVQGEQDKLLRVPAGYRAVKAHVTCSGGDNGGNCQTTGVIGRHGFVCTGTKEEEILFEMAGEDDIVPVGVTMTAPALSPPVFGYGPLVAVEIECEPGKPLLETWQIKTYEALLAGYHRLKAAYYRLSDAKNGGSLSARRSRLACRRIEREQLKQGCLRQLIARYQKQVGGAVGMFINTGKPTRMAVNEPRYLQFFETVFEWPEMTYTFYSDLIQGYPKHPLALLSITRLAGDDERFTAFLQADLARVMVPVNPGEAARPLLAAQAIYYFLSQDYPERELIVVYEKSDDLPHPLPVDKRIRYLRYKTGTHIGSKRNYAVTNSQGSIIAQWDDDDWYSVDRLSRQAASLINGEADITGLAHTLFFDLHGWRFWACSPALFARMFAESILGGSLVYRKAI